ncbi:IS1 family transposase [Spartinivicinus ruber]|uniref:IS1 family transposase n=1 Tax=Spartinivicinus ruber TaxID=2683272 RepID=UPI0013D49DF8
MYSTLARMKPFGIKLFSTDNWEAYSRHIPAEKHVIVAKYVEYIAKSHDFNCKIMLTNYILIINTQPPPTRTAIGNIQSNNLKELFA